MSATEPQQPSRAGAGGGAGIGALVGVLVLAFATPVIGRVWIEGRAELALADAAAAEGEFADEVLHLGRAARMRLPLAEHDELARARLLALAQTAGEDARTSDALLAWRELRSAIIGTRTIGMLDDAQLHAANLAIVELMVAQANAAGAPAEAARWTAELDEDTQPRGRSLLAALCFVGWLGACVGLFLRGVDGKGHLEPRAATRWGAALVSLLLGWILLM